MRLVGVCARLAFGGDLVGSVKDCEILDLGANPMRWTSLSEDHRFNLFLWFEWYL